MTLNAKSFEVQRWHSPEYVEFWMTRRNREERRSILRKKLVSSLPFEPESSMRVLDLGAGGGALSQEVLACFPKTHIVCQDFSEVMLGHARQQLAKFGDRVTFISSDLSTPAWVNTISGTFEAVVSSLAMHTVPNRVKDIYIEILGLIKPGGCFVFADILASPGQLLKKVYLKQRLKSLQARVKAETGEEKSLKEIEQELREQRRKRSEGFPERNLNSLRDTLTLANHLEWLRQAGFTEVDCLWKELNQAVIGGFKYSDSGK